jgi:hypothetical protein
MGNTDIENLQKEIEELKKYSQELAERQDAVSRILKRMQDQLDQSKSNT